MAPPRITKAVINENKYPYIVEIVVATDGLDVKLSRQIVQFHKSRQIRPRHGRTITRQHGLRYHWCFTDLLIARDFAEQFGGGFCKPMNSE